MASCRPAWYAIDAVSAAAAFAGTGTTYSATFTRKPNFRDAGTVSVAAGTFTDRAGDNDVAGARAAALSIDT